MKRVVTGVVLAGACVAAQAQSSVTLYGSLDAGVAYVNNRAGGKQVSMVQGTMQPDRWGFRGVEDLGGGLSAIFQLENGFSTNTGALTRSGYMFNRQAFVGLSSKQYGTLTLGHQTPFNFDWLGPMSTAYLAQSFWAFHPGNLDELANTTSAQQDNTVKYRSPTYYGLTFGAMYGFGGQAGDFGYARTFGFGVNYANGPLKLAAAYNNEHNRSLFANIGNTTLGMGLSSFQGVPVSGYVADKVENVGAGGSYQFGKLMVHALYTHVKLSYNGINNGYQAFDAGASYQFTTANSVAGGASTTTFVGRRFTQFELGDIYALSKRTQLYAQAIYERATGNGAQASLLGIGPSSNGKQLMFVAGIHHSF